MKRIFFFWIATAALAASRDERFFDQRVWPILTKRCLPCHNDQLNNGGLSFASRASVMKGGGRGPALVPGSPEQSLLIQSLRHDGDLQMPPGPKLPEKEIRILTDWVKRDAVWGSSARQ